jgi:sigma-B regulation protein RsbU (phosphoserine phosphatase)
MFQGTRKRHKMHKEGKADYSILVVEDEETNMILVRETLEQAGFTVHSAYNGRDGIAKAREFTPDLVILDVLLPDIDGFAVCECLKSDKAARDIPIIFVTSLDDSDSKIRGLSIGGVDYITKPFDGAEIVARVRIHLKLRNADRIIIESQRRKLAALNEAQTSFLTDLDAMPDANCAAFFEPAEEAGGDQYDAIRLGPSIYGYFVADIAGHGIETSLVSSVLKALFRENASLLDAPDETFRRINALMKEYLAEGQHITAAYLLVNRVSCSATLLSAGHLPVIISRPDGSTTLLKAEGDVLGVFDAPVFKAASIEAAPGTRFWMFSDGIVEDFDSGQSWKRGMCRLQDNIAKTCGLPIKRALDKAIDGLHSRHPGLDDRLLMVCEA